MCVGIQTRVTMKIVGNELQFRLINNKFLVFIARMLHNFMLGLTETYIRPAFYSSLLPCKPYRVPA